nr:Transcription termination factor like [Ipomoea batatas]
MLNLVCKIFSHNGRSSIVRISPTEGLCFLQLAPFSSSIAVESSSATARKASFACSYFINELGFAQERALRASRYVNFETPEKPDSVRSFLRNHGFTESQISNMVRRFPPVLLCDPEKTLLPKIEFFKSSGLSQEDLIDLLTATPQIFWNSVENKLAPTFDFLNSMFGSSSNTVMAMKTFQRNLNFEHLQCNVRVLRDAGVPKSNIVNLLKHCPRVFHTDKEKFGKIVEDVKAMGFSPSKVMFVLAIKAFATMNKVTWSQKMEAYKKFGFSEPEILETFEKHPWCMMVSTEKIVAVVDFLVNKMGFERSVLMKRPVLLSLSLKKRIAPRFLVYQTLLAKGLVKDDLNLLTMLMASEEKFLKNYIECHTSEASELLKLYTKLRCRAHLSPYHTQTNPIAFLLFVHQEN